MVDSVIFEKYQNLPSGVVDVDIGWLSERASAAITRTIRLQLGQTIYWDVNAILLESFGISSRI